MFACSVRPGFMLAVGTVAAISASAPLLAGSASGQLVVSVTVTRSCAVGTVSQSASWATLDVQCSGGAASTLQSGTNQKTGSGTLRVQVPTATSTTGASGGLPVATINF